MTRLIRFAAVAAAWLAVAGCASQNFKTTGSFESLGAPQVGESTSQMPEYRIGPLDKLSITVFQSRELSQPTVQVDASGQILLPMIGVLMASGKTNEELSAEIAVKLTDCCLRNPDVAVLVIDAVSQQITITGAVEKSGVYNLRGRTTLLQAVSMAGGPNNATANSKRVAVYRVVDNQRVGALFDLTAIRAGQAEDPQIYGGDTIIVDSSNAKSAWRNVTGAIPFFSIFRPF